MNLANAITDFIEDKTQKKIESSGQDLIKSGILDSFTMIQLISFLENEIKAKIDMENLSADNFNSISNIVKTIELWK